MPLSCSLTQNSEFKSLTFSVVIKCDLVYSELCFSLTAKHTSGMLNAGKRNTALTVLTHQLFSTYCFKLHQSLSPLPLLFQFIFPCLPLLPFLLVSPSLPFTFHYSSSCCLLITVPPNPSPSRSLSLRHSPAPHLQTAPHFLSIPCPCAFCGPLHLFPYLLHSPSPFP